VITIRSSWQLPIENNERAVKLLQQASVSRAHKYSNLEWRSASRRLIADATKRFENREDPTDRIQSSIVASSYCEENIPKPAQNCPNPLIPGCLSNSSLAARGLFMAGVPVSPNDCNQTKEVKTFSKM